MKVKGFDGRVHNWKLTGHIPLGSDARPRSKEHRRARELLAEMYPCESRLEEVALPGGGKLSVDFFLPNRKLAIEVHGRQHYEFVSFFHKSRLGFLQSLKRDSDKREWFRTNSLICVELCYKESDDEWRDRLRAAEAS